MRFLVTWIVLAGFWIGLSGYYDRIHLTFGAVSVTLVAALAAGHLFPDGRVVHSLVTTLRTLLYTPWLMWQILLANVDVMLRILGFRPIEPRVFSFESDVETEFGATLFANSITLTPGTVTVDVDGRQFVVHAISPEAAEGVLSRAMEDRVKKIEGSYRSASRGGGA